MAKKTIFEKVRSLDIFGADVDLNYQGSASYKTIGGAICTVLFYTGILIYSGMQILSVVGYKEPQINSYDILENRGDMKSALRFGEHNLNFVFGFMD